MGSYEDYRFMYRPGMSFFVKLPDMLEQFTPSLRGDLPLEDQRKLGMSRKKCICFCTQQERGYWLLNKDH